MSVPDSGSNPCLDVKGTLDRIDELRKRADEIFDRMRRTRSVRRKAELEEEVWKLNDQIRALWSQLDSCLDRIVEEIKEIHWDFRGLNYPTAKSYHYARFDKDEKLLEIRTHWLTVKSLEEFDKVIESLRNIAKKYGIPIRFIVDGRWDHFTLSDEDKMKLPEKYGAIITLARDYIIMINP